MAKIDKNTQGAFTGAFLIIIGFLLLFAWPFGTIIGVLLIFAGSQFGTGFRCGACGNKIDSKQVKMCPTCKTALYI